MYALLPSCVDTTPRAWCVVPVCLSRVGAGSGVAVNVHLIGGAASRNSSKLSRIYLPLAATDLGRGGVLFRYTSLPRFFLHRRDEMSARLVAAFAMMGAARAVVSTIGQVSQVSFEAYNQMGEALDADSRDVTMTNDGDCCMPHWARTPDNRPSIDAFLPGLDSCLHL